MDKFQRLKWIPMIVKAYNDARQQAEQRSLPPSLPADPPPSETHPEYIQKQPPGQPRKAVARTNSVEHMSARSKKVVVNTRTKSVEPRNHATKAPLIREYQQVIRELRQTKDKLGQLESVHKRLTESQAQIQSQLSQLLQQIQQSPELRPSDSDSDTQDASSTLQEP